MGRPQEATDACTVIPSDFRDLHNTPLRYPSFSNVLSCIQICGQAPPTPEIQTHLIAFDATESARMVAPGHLGAPGRKREKSSILPFEAIYNDMKATTGTCDFVVTNSLLYVSAIQAMMLWCLNEEDRSVTIHIVDPSFNRPAGWSYRYFWRHQAKTHKGGLSINHVGVIANDQAFARGRGKKKRAEACARGRKHRPRDHRRGIKVYTPSRLRSSEDIDAKDTSDGSSSIVTGFCGRGVVASEVAEDSEAEVAEVTDAEVTDAEVTEDAEDIKAMERSFSLGGPIEKAAVRSERSAPLYWTYRVLRGSYRRMVLFITPRR